MSVAVVGDPFTFIRRLRRSLRDARDRAARSDLAWRAVQIGGVVVEGKLLVLVRHVGIPRLEVAAVFGRQRWWFDPVWSEVPCGEPSAYLSVEHAAGLARRRRGLEPFRVVVFPQRNSSTPQH